jgi:hypothetical protein
MAWAFYLEGNNKAYLSQFKSHLSPNNFPTPFLNLHDLSKLTHILLIRQNPGARIIEIQVGLPGLSIPVLLHFQDCFDRLGGLNSTGEI